MKHYKIRHIASGLFFKPAGYTYSPNLSKKGKVYSTIPSATYLGKFYFHPRTDELSLRRDVDLSEWEIVEYEVKEVAKRGFDANK